MSLLQTPTKNGGTTRPLRIAYARFDAGLRRLLIKLGAEEKYHAMLTWFFLLLVAERFESDEPWQVFKHRNADLIDDSKQILSRYYSEEY